MKVASADRLNAAKGAPLPQQTISVFGTILPAAADRAVTRSNGQSLLDLSHWQVGGLCLRERTPSERQPQAAFLAINPIARKSAGSYVLRTRASLAFTGGDQVDNPLEPRLIIDRLAINEQPLDGGAP